MPGPALLLLVVIFGCNCVISGHDPNGQQEATAKETLMKVTKNDLCEKIAEVTTLGILSTVAVVAAAQFAATSG